MIVVFALYVWLGAVANSFLNHNLFYIITAYVFNPGNFILEKIVMSLFLGWLSIPITFIMWCCGVRSK